MAGKNSDYKLLVDSARKAQRQAYTPYSHFHVGASLLTKSGRIYTGCNIENSSYSLTICAERVAIFKAISEGETSFKAAAVFTNDPDLTSPCGACRQVLFDLAGNIDIVICNHSGKQKIVKLQTLLPMAFGANNLKRTKKK
jgi:cytidine deaminase